MKKSNPDIFGNMRVDDNNKIVSEKLCKKLLDTEKEINKRRMHSVSLNKGDNDSVAFSDSNRSSKHSGTSGYYSMLPSARERIENQHSFMNYYKYLCEINNSVPKVKVQRDQELQFYGDRIRSEDWMPIIKAIENDRSLRVIKILNRNLSHAGFTRDPAIYKRKILNLLVVALEKCFSNSKMLNVIHLGGLPFSTANLKILCTGLEKTTSIQCIELPCCSIGNKGCEMLCRILRHKTNIKSLDLSSCGITADGMQHISHLIQAQKITRYGDCWKQSLRYRQPNPSGSDGLLRLVLDNNINLGDSGFTCLVNSLLDDLWVKEIHCQNCGLTNDSAYKAINLAKSNYFIKCIDIRRNLPVDPDLVNALERLLMFNYSSIPFHRMWNSEGDFCEPVADKNNKNYGTSNSSRLKSSSGYSCPSNKDTNSSLKLSRSNSSVTVNVPPLRISHVPKKYSSHNNSVTKQKSYQLQQTKKELRETKSRLILEISKRMAAEKYCKQLELQLKEKENYVLIEKSLLKKLIQTFQEFSFVFTDITKTEVKDKLEDEKINFENETSIPVLKTDNLTCDTDDLKKNKNKSMNTLNLSKNLNPAEIEFKVNLHKNFVNDPKLRAQQLFNEILKNSAKINLYDAVKDV